MIYGYARVSSIGQEDNTSLQNQERQILTNYPTAIVVKEVYTGSTAERPKFQELLTRLEKGDKLVVCKLDRFCRNVKEGLETLDYLRGKGVAVHFLDFGQIDDSPMGRVMATMFLAFAEFERASINSRCKEGKARKRELDPDYKEGRPSISVDKVAQARLEEQVAKGEISRSEAARRLGISRSSYYRSLLG